MERLSLHQAILAKGSFLCVGLDSDVERLPKHLPRTPAGMLAFNKAIIEATAAHCVAYKLNTAFYEALGPAGFEVLHETQKLIPKDILAMADAKRGDIGNTAKQYAKAFFEAMDFDALTVNPYMGEDSIRPYLDFPDKAIVALGLTSNAGAEDVELLDTPQGKVYEQTMRKLASWVGPEQLMFVVGATRPELLGLIRQEYPEHFFLVPGVGAQGGSLEQVFRHGHNAQVGLLVNSSRGIIFASEGEDFAEAAGRAAAQLAQQMRNLLAEQGLHSA